MIPSDNQIFLFCFVLFCFVFTKIQTSHEKDLGSWMSSIFSTTSFLEKLSVIFIGLLTVNVPRASGITLPTKVQLQRNENGWLRVQ